MIQYTILIKKATITAVHESYHRNERYEHTEAAHDPICEGCLFSAPTPYCSQTSLAMPADSNWAEELPPRTETTNKEGIKTVIEYELDKDGNKIKITRKSKLTPVGKKVNKRVEERKNWARFGTCRGMKVDEAEEGVTMRADAITLKLTLRTMDLEEATTTKEVAPKKALTVVCRICGKVGDHFSHKCPFKDKLVSPEDEEEPAAAPVPTTGKYIPPSLRDSVTGMRISSDKLKNDHDSQPSLRISNLTEEARDTDLRDLFGRFGRVTRVNVVYDRNTGRSRGYAYVNFSMRSEAQAAIDALNGFGYDNLILSVEWAKSSL